MGSGFGIRPNSSISQLENIFANPFKQQKPDSEYSDVIEVYYVRKMINFQFPGRICLYSIRYCKNVESIIE